MTLPARDRALRRMVADLTRLHATDLAAIVADLDSVEREAVERLLQSYAPASLEPTVTDAHVEFDSSQLSEWLVQRIEARAPSGKNHAVTADVRRALRDRAARLLPVRPPASDERPKSWRGAMRKPLPRWPVAQ